MNADEHVIAEAVRSIFRAGEGRDFARLRAFHAEEPAFSRWSNRPGGDLLDIAAAHEEEESAFGALTPGTRVTPEQIRVDLFGPVAVSTFLVHVTAPEGVILRRTRGTLVWRHNADGWRIVHEHFSP
jgi:ketosteroid isomerase-like protein